MTHPEQVRDDVLTIAGVLLRSFRRLIRLALLDADRVHRSQALDRLADDIDAAEWPADLAFAARNLAAECRDAASYGGRWLDDLARAVR